MSSIPYIIIIIVLIIAFAWYTAKTNAIKQDKEKEEQEEDKISNTEDYPYQKKNLLTITEYKFYKTLKKLCDENNLLICPKVRMEDFINITDKQNAQKYRGKIKSRHIDFIICNKDLYLLAGLELDDGTHNTQKAKETDEFKDNVFKKINLPLFRIKTNPEDYEKEINNMIKKIAKK